MAHRKLFRGTNSDVWARTFVDKGWPPAAAKIIAEFVTAERGVPRWTEVMAAYNSDWLDKGMPTAWPEGTER